MTAYSTNSTVDWFFDKDSKWQKEYKQLRKIVLNCGLIEELKWGVPCYTFQRKNIVLIHGFKEYCALLFPKGSLLNNAEGILIQQTKHVQGARQIRFKNSREIAEQEATLKAHIYEAIALEEAGIKIKLKKTSEFNMPEDFQKELDKSPVLKTAFEALTPGRQRGYLLYFSAAKQSKTRMARIEKYRKQILNGKGLND